MAILTNHPAHLKREVCDSSITSVPDQQLGPNWVRFDRSRVTPTENFKLRHYQRSMPIAPLTLAVLCLFALAFFWERGFMKSDTANPLDRSPVHLLHRASSGRRFVFAMGVETNDLTARQLAVLLAVADNEGLSQTDLVERTGVDRSTLADIVKRLKGKGLLQRKRTKEDARAYAVKLTEEGRKAPAHGGAAGQAG